MERLCEDPRNKVCIVSSADRIDLARLFGDIPQLDLVAESGFVYAKGQKRRSLAATGRTNVRFGRRSKPNSDPVKWVCVMPPDEVATMDGLLCQAVTIVRQCVVSSLVFLCFFGRCLFFARLRTVMRCFFFWR